LYYSDSLLYRYLGFHLHSRVSLVKARVNIPRLLFLAWFRNCTKLADKEMLIKHLGQELGASKHQVEQLGVELDEKDKHAKCLKVELDWRKARVDKVEA
jgi:hypothetical protein